MSNPDAAADTSLPAQMQRRWYNSAAFNPADPWADLDVTRAAVVLVDLINWQAHPDGSSLMAVRAAGRGDQVDYVVGRCAEMVMPGLRDVLPAARAAAVPIVHVRLASRSKDYDDLVPAFQPYLRGSGALDGDPCTEPVEGLWEDGDISVVKRGSGAFSSDLDRLLRERGIDTVLYAGVLTSACVLLSAATGFDLGYRQYLLADATAAFTPADQEAAERFIGTYLAQIVTTASAAAALRKRAAG
ncbi:isochorismatase family cysteine hydrolase [Streptomyces sp. NPDC097610]|uniref:isochorismatase family cysteine hydrolase n=1 Tax=Streptomyces sp. NPDC097610 TaxID=3157227 RepID=UPI00332CC0F2